MTTLPWILLSCAVGAFILYGLGIWSTRRHTRRAIPSVPADGLPPVSLLKPIKGTEEALETNLRSFYEQAYPGALEVVFSSTELDDPGMDVARRVAADYPHIPTQFVRSDPDFGLNPKVANLAGALAAASYDLVLQSDANVRARPDYLERVVSEAIAVGANLSSSMVIGVGERSLGAAMENLQLSALIAPSTCTALHVAGVTCVIGKSMLFRKSELDEVGGLGIVRDILAEDFILGQAYEKAGKKSLLSTTTIENVNHDVTVERFVSRHGRWLKMRTVIHVGSFIADLFANPVGLGFWALAASGFAPRFGVAFAGIVAVKLVGDRYLMSLTRTAPMKLRYLWVAPIKDVLMTLVWLHASVSRSVEWRGVRLRFGKESRLRPDPGPLPVRLLRRIVG